MNLRRNALIALAVLVLLAAIAIPSRTLINHLSTKYEPERERIKNVRQNKIESCLSNSTIKCEGPNCWGSSYQRTNFLSDASDIKDTTTRIANIISEKRVFSEIYQGKWFADWWQGSYWEMGYFKVYDSKEECYVGSLQAVIEAVTDQDITTWNTEKCQNVMELLNRKNPVRCFPSSTPYKDRWNYPLKR